MDETIIDDRDVDILVRQYRMIEENKFRDLCRDLSDLLPSLSLIYDQLEEWISGIQDERLRSRARKQCRQESLAPYFLVNFFYSLLVGADKTDAVVGRHYAHFIEFDKGVLSADTRRRNSLVVEQSLNRPIKRSRYGIILLRPGAFVINLPTDWEKPSVSYLPAS